MLTADRLTRMSDSGLIWTRDDLKAVIAIQEETVRQHGPGACPKLNEYWDDLHATLGEIKARASGQGHRCHCGHICEKSLPQAKG